MTDRRIASLDAIRGFAAVYVAAGHLVHSHFPDAAHGVRLAFAFGQEAVMLFFLLSGYVIQRSVMAAPHLTAGGFLWRRFLRLYPLILLALFVSYATVALAAGRLVPPRLGTALGNLLAMQDFAPVKPGVLSDVYFENAPLWSLSYECWFYIWFAVLHWRVAPRLRTPLVALWCLGWAVVLFVRPNGVAYWAAYFAIWWVGRSWALATGDVPEAKREARVGLLVFPAVALVVAAGVWWRVGYCGDVARPGTYPVLILRHFTFAGMAIAAVMLSGDRLRDLALRLLAPFGSLAAWSYGLFVLHAPLSAHARWLPVPLSQASGFLVYGAIGVVFSWYAETRYQPWARRHLDAGARRIFARSERT